MGRRAGQPHLHLQAAEGREVPRWQGADLRRREVHLGNHLPRGQQDRCAAVRVLLTHQGRRGVSQRDGSGDQRHHHAGSVHGAGRDAVDLRALSLHLGVSADPAQAHLRPLQVRRVEAERGNHDGGPPGLLGWAAEDRPADRQDRAGPHHAALAAANRGDRRGRDVPGPAVHRVRGVLPRPQFQGPGDGRLLEPVHRVQSDQPALPGRTGAAGDDPRHRPRGAGEGRAAGPRPGRS